MDKAIPTPLDLLQRFVTQFENGNLDGDNTVKADLLGHAYELLRSWKDIRDVEMIMFSKQMTKAEFIDIYGTKGLSDE